MIRVDFLQQNAFDEDDTYTSFDKQYEMLATIMKYDDEANKALDLGAYYDEIIEGTSDVREQISRMKFIPEANFENLEDLRNEIVTDIREVLQKGGEN